MGESFLIKLLKMIQKHKNIIDYTTAYLLDYTFEELQ